MTPNEAKPLTLTKPMTATRARSTDENCVTSDLGAIELSAGDKILLNQRQAPAKTLDPDGNPALLCLYSVISGRWDGAEFVGLVRLPKSDE